MKVLTHKKYPAGFTFAELIISVIIGSIVLTILMNFIAISMNEISYSNKKTEALENINYFSHTLNTYKGAFQIGEVIIDKAGNGSDVMLMKNKEESEGIVIGVVSMKTLQLEELQNDYEKIYKKHLAIRPVTSDDIVNLTANPEGVYDLNFNKDKVFHNLVMKDIQATIYNSGSIIDMNLDVLINYKEGVDGENWASITNDWIYRINMNF